MEKLNDRLSREFKETPDLTPAAKDTARKRRSRRELTEEERGHLKGVSNGGYHYLGAAKILAPIGKALAEAVLEVELKRAPAPGASKGAGR
ncbi:MAG: hypothetical protein U0800_09500 [Isosphaeraceae bacterium]